MFNVIKDEHLIWTVVDVILIRISEFLSIKHTAIYLNNEIEPHKFVMKSSSGEFEILENSIELERPFYENYFSSESVRSIKERNTIQDSFLYAKISIRQHQETIKCIYAFPFSIDAKLKGIVVFRDRAVLNGYRAAKNSLSHHSIEFLEKICHELKMEISNQYNIKKLKENITDLQNINIKLERADKIREHETRAPLASIIANAGFVAKYINEKAATSKERKLKEIIDDAEICAFLLKTTKVPVKEELVESFYTVSPNQLILEVVNFVKRQILRISDLIFNGEKNEIEYDFEITPAINVEFTGTSSKTALNPHLFKRVLYNICINAIKYGKKNGLLRIELTQNNENIIIQFIDDGRGIEDEDAPYIFDEGYRGAKIKTRFSGEGLGLSIAKKIVEIHDGSIELKQKRDPTIFKISLPVRKINKDNQSKHPNIIRQDPFIIRRTK
jgi:signal transduction histidine kinase